MSEQMLARDDGPLNATHVPGSGTLAFAAVAPYISWCSNQNKYRKRNVVGCTYTGRPRGVSDYPHAWYRSVS